MAKIDLKLTMRSASRLIEMILTNNALISSSQSLPTWAAVGVVS